MNEREEEKPSDLVKDEYPGNVEQISNIQIIDTQRINSIMYKQYSIDLHNMGYNEAIENVRMKVNELVNIQ